MTADSRKRGFALAKWSLFALVLYFVCQKAFRLWDPALLGDRTIAWPWLLASGTVYVIGWLPCLLFWRLILRSLGSQPSWSVLLRAYYYGHLGKYVPGKAAAIVIRTSMLKAENVPMSVSMVSVVLETLGTMGVGLAVGLGLAAFVLPDEAWLNVPLWIRPVHEHAWLGPLLVGLAAVVFVSLGAASLIKLAARLSKTGLADVQSPSDLRRVLVVGLLLLIPTWLLHGLSLGLVLESVGAAVWTWQSFMVWTGAIGAGSSLGFFVLFAPGGLGVREGLLMTFLQPSVGGPVAVLAAALLRLVWLIAELAAAGILMTVMRLIDRGKAVSRSST
jgi:uncharacterized membrane protein YbhN (UPF0104 family)